MSFTENHPSFSSESEASDCDEPKADDVDPSRSTDVEDEDNAAEDGLPESVSVDMPMEENGGENNGANGEVNGGENGKENGSENGDVNVNSGNCDFDPDVSSDSFDSDLECQECEETFKTRKELDAHLNDPNIHPQFWG